MIEISDLAFSYKNEQLFSGVNLQLQSPGLTLLSGANGRGKTTLLKLIAGVLTPSSGRISYDGIDIKGAKMSELAKLRSVAPQRRSFELAFSVTEILNIAAKVSQRRNEVVERLELGSLLNSRVTELSLGQQQRVSVALSLVQESDYYLLDEPFSAQDSHFEVVMIELLQEIAKKRGVLVISHHTDNVHTSFDFSLTL